MSEPLCRDSREEQNNPQAGAERLGGMFTGASNFTLVNPQFQAATTIQNNYHTWSGCILKSLLHILE
ncbi:hypothetical protein BDP27DRAFT_1426314 [Rhodocollybia butyracea]|uniref:Uncharacterized protein n=1 Tax=Rhodocollybia butyracea TaxID=206335 RepID=A0A9P5PHJ5_9AGAR|nr:hypothetical protein BDP27DRAFT_1426314 [Rhodocollybia butyracea]